MPLVQGQRFRYHADCGDLGVWEVLRVTPCSAIVRPANRVQREVHALDKKTGEEKVVRFSAPQGSVMISPNSSVVLIEDSEEQ